MEDETAITCDRCGNCCQTDLIAYVIGKDRARWAREGREDILTVLRAEHAVWAGDRIVSTENGSFARFTQGCPFLSWDGRLFSCDIYETRPRVCRDFVPGSSELCSRFRGRKKERA